MIRCRRRILIPARTPIPEIVDDRLNQARDFRLAFDELQRHALARVPGYVAMHQPRSIYIVSYSSQTHPGRGWYIPRIVALECNDQISIARECGRITARGILAVQLCCQRSEQSLSGSQDVEIVAVEMERVVSVDEGVVLDDPVRPLVSALEK
jgi:hypothetical protein